MYRRCTGTEGSAKGNIDGRCGFGQMMGGEKGRDWWGAFGVICARYDDGGEDDGL